MEKNVYLSPCTSYEHDLIVQAYDEILIKSGLLLFQVK